MPTEPNDAPTGPFWQLPLPLTVIVEALASRTMLNAPPGPFATPCTIVTVDFCSERTLPPPAAPLFASYVVKVSPSLPIGSFTVIVQT